MSRDDRHARRDAARAAKRTRRLQGVHLRTSPGWATVVQSLAFVRKELVEILRQPKLLLLLVLGPFLLLLLFGLGYKDTDVALRTMFVGAEGSVYEEGVTRFADDLEDYIDSRGFTSDEAAAVDRLHDGELDAVVVFPDDALDRILNNEHAPIRVLHDKLNPVQQTAVEIASRLAVQEVNATVVGVVAGGAQQAIGPIDTLAADVGTQSAAMVEAVAAGSADDTAAVAAAAVTILQQSEAGIAAARQLLDNLGATEQTAAYADVLARLDAASSEALAVSAGGPDAVDQGAALADDLGELSADLPALTTIDSDVLVRPFAAEVESIAPVRVAPADFFAPGAIVLLLQHLAVTFAALSLVRDRQLGLFELLRVGPLSSMEILTGKTIAYLLIGAAVAAALVGAAVGLLGTPLVGSILWLAITCGLVLLAALALGLLLSLISGSEIQAVQYAMLSLLAGMFFSGFFLDVELLSYPVRAVSYVLPVTYGVAMMQDVMLRGQEPATADLVGLGALIGVYGILAILLLKRRLRTV